jgi:hypothetical protein
MIKVFIEYKLEPGCKDEIIRLSRQAGTLLSGQGASDYRIFEGVDQPGLIVEEFWVGDAEDYRRYKEERLQGRRDLWLEMNACAAGGAEKIHIWAFREA